MKSIFVGIAILFSVAANADTPQNHFHLPEGGRKGLHGMVLYGSSGVYFLDHIPMEQAPHDLQVIAQVKLKTKNGHAVTTQDFSKATFTLKPNTNFSLNDYTAGRLQKFSGDIYVGGFEQGGSVLTDNVEVEVAQIKLVRQIPSTSAGTSIELSDGTNTFEINVMTPTQNVQSVKNKSTGQELWCVKGPDFFEPCQK